MRVSDPLKTLEASRAHWLRIYWCDYAASIRCRLIPTSLVKMKLQNNEPVTLTITKASLGLLPNDHMIPGMEGVGGYTLAPDWSSLRSGPTLNQLTCVGEFRDKEDGSDVILCPRTALRKSLEVSASHEIEFILGFEIEFIVMERNDDKSSPEQYLPISNDGHAWSMARSLADWGRKGSFVSALDELADQLEGAGIGIEQLQAESAPGQYEVVLSPLPALEACDAYLLARQIIESTAARHGFRATMHPKPYIDEPGNATHVHMSIASPGGNEPAMYESFYAGILTHLRAITAFTYTNPVSYKRALDSCWAGGRWVAWGLENRETPLRKCEKGHWEYRLMDGLANPYLALAAILSAGTSGVVEETKMIWKDCPHDPASLSEAERDELKITEMLPQDLQSAIGALKQDKLLHYQLGTSIIERHIATKEAEIKLLEGMEDMERRQWIIARF